MSVTTTANPVTTTVRQVLQDYDLHHSGSDGNTTAAPPNTRSNPTQNASNPSNWPNDHRGIPSYRPIDRTLDMEQRPGGMNIPGSIFITTMLTGCRIVGMGNTAWRATIGRIDKRLLGYEIGGEF